MNTLYILYIIIAYLFILYFLFAPYIKQHAHSALLQQYTTYLIASSLGNEDESGHSLQAKSRLQRKTLIQAIHSLISHTYDCPKDLIQLIVKQNNLQLYILKQLPHSTALQKYHLLSQLSSIIYDDTTIISQLKSYLNNRNRHIRTNALIAILAAKPSELITIISSLKFELQPLDIIHIIALIRQGSLFVVLEPLFESRNINLQKLALAIVRNFGIDIADKYIYGIISSEKNLTIVDDAIYTLTALKRPLKYKVLRKRVATSSEFQRKRLCRHLSVEGYSLQSIKAILDPAECQYAKRLITSYKGQLTQSQTV